VILGAATLTTGPQAVTVVETLVVALNSATLTAGPQAVVIVPSAAIVVLNVAIIMALAGRIGKNTSDITAILHHMRRR
jgi:hypothetical protein